MIVSENSLFQHNSLAQNSVDWSVILQRVCEKSYFKETTRSKLQESLTDPDVINAHFDRIDNLMQDFDHFLFMHDKMKGSVDNEFSINNIFSNEEILNNQDLHALHEIYRFIEFYKEYKKDLGNHHLEQEIIRQMEDFRLVVNKDGEVNYAGHPRFRSIMNEIHDCEHEARIKVRSIIQRMGEDGLLQNDQHDIINDRYIVAVKSDTYSANLGRIISRSARFKTMYIEPPSMREYSDKRMLLMSKLQEQIYYFEKENIDLLIKYRQIITLLVQEIYDFDFYFAKTFFCRINSLSRPDLVQSKEVSFKDIFHPLIQKPIKNSFKLEQNQDNLVISGPNTGGKSVFMKSVAISYLFASKGIFAPCAYAKLFWPEHIFYIGNLNENIEEGLSSFSGEVHALMTIIEKVQNSTAIVFADEIFNSTSSEEASAIACSILDEIHSNSASLCFVSTHHSSLKRIAQDKPSYEVCHFGFDEARNIPNYQLQWGESGNSRAISILKNISSKFVDRVVGRIGNFMDQSYVEYEKLQADLRNKVAEAEEKLEHANKLEYKLNQKLARAENEVALFRERELKRTEQKMQSIIAKANKLVKEMKQAPKAKVNEIYELKREIVVETPVKEDVRLQDKKPVSIEDVKEGEKYYSTFAKSTVEVKSINTRKKQVQITMGGKAIWQKVEDLYEDIRINPSYSKKQQPIETNASLVAKEVPIEHDCRGMRLDDFQKYVEDILSALFTEEAPYLNIIHGHGTGVLKKWLRDKIKRDRSLTFEVPDGNDGSTIVKLS
jgi:DNA mismatch repair protein MutS2